MKKSYSYFACIIFIQLFAITKINAQTIDVTPSVLKLPPLNITVDGNLTNWGDSLKYLNAENNIRYVIYSDKENLYFAAKLVDRTEAVRVLKAGITLGLDPKGKKKTAYSLTFPINLPEGDMQLVSKDNNLSEITQADRDELVRETITTLRGIKVAGFKDIEGDMITTSNTYGIKTAINYDDKGNLICEAAIPLKFFHLDNQLKTQWVFDIKINGISQPVANRDEAGGNNSSMGGGRGGSMGSGGGRGHGGRGGNNSTKTNGLGIDGGALAKSVDFSGKFFLAPVQ